MSAENIVPLKVTYVKAWTETLFSFRVTRPEGFRFTAGQFVSLGMNPQDLQYFNSNSQVVSLHEEQTIFRAYSIISSEYDEFLEFFSVVIPDGAFTSQLQYLQVGDTLWLKMTSFGFLTLARYQSPTPYDLWLFATGTGLAPFLSILKNFEVWQQYQHITLVYSVRYAKELAYAGEIETLSAQFNLEENGAGFTFVPIITREADYQGLNQRLPRLLLSGELETKVGLKMDTKTSHIMLCGNPEMVEDTKETLKSLGFSMNRRGEGNISVENYW